MSTPESRMLEHADRMMEAILGPRAKSRDDARSQDEARTDYLNDLSQDATTDLICDICVQHAPDIAMRIAEGDAIALLQLFEKQIDRGMASEGK